MLFVSRRKRFRIVLKPSTYVLDAYGQRVQIPGITKEFTNGRLYEDDPQVIDMLLHNPHRPAHYDCAASKDEEEAWLRAHPELGPVQMSGRVGTATAQGAPAMAPEMPSSVTSTQQPLRDAARSNTPVVDLEKMLDDKINEKINPLLDKIDMLLEASAPKATPKPKKVFTCPVPGCGQTFRSGLEVGAHKKTDHVIQDE